MANHSERPTLDLAAGRAVLSEDLPRALELLGVSSEAELGWRKTDNRTLIVPIRGQVNGHVEEYTLRLQFFTGRDWPPSAQFVNPITLQYTFPDDVSHLPILQSPEVHVHPQYQSASETLQLICCSATLEYYSVLHGGDNNILWQPKDTFLTTIAAIERAMNSFHTGRQPRHEG